jgi:hypothetical protein
MRLSATLNDKAPAGYRPLAGLMGLPGCGGPGGHRHQRHDPGPQGALGRRGLRPDLAVLLGTFTIAVRGQFATKITGVLETGMVAIAVGEVIAAMQTSPGAGRISLYLTEIVDAVWVTPSIWTPLQPFGLSPKKTATTICVVKSTEGLALGGMIEFVCSAHSVFHDGRSRATAVRKLEIEDDSELRTVKGTVTGLLSSPPSTV